MADKGPAEVPVELGPTAAASVASATPVWRRDFPYETAAEEEVTRREFGRYLVLGTGALAAGNLGLAVWTELRSINTGDPRAIIALDDVAEGGTHLFRYPTSADPAILYRVAGDEPQAPGAEARIVAFSQKCTHLGCVVYYQADEERWHCPCHEGNFELLTGHVISGPPVRPLGRIDVEVRDDGMIWALGQVDDA